MSKIPLPRSPGEIIGMIVYLERKKAELLQMKCFAGALSLGAQIEMLKWAYNLEEYKE